jgi:hypothetical protein
MSVCCRRSHPSFCCLPMFGWAVDDREIASLMRPISCWLDMNTRATPQRSHRSHISDGSPVRLCVSVSGRGGLTEAADQCKHGSIRRRFIPMIENGGSRRIAPVTAQRMIAIHNSAARALLKPMLADAAKMTRIITRRPKRTRTRVDRKSWGRFGIWATADSAVGSCAALPEMIGIDALIKLVAMRHHDRNAGPD